MRPAVVTLGDIEIVSQGPYDVEPASTLAEKVRRQLRSERETGPAIENVQNRSGFAPVEHDFNWPRGVTHDVTKQLAEYEPPPLDAAVDEALLDYMNRRKASFPDSNV